MNPRFSVIVVCLNSGDKLVNTVFSVLDQTFRDFEIIVKDGNSSDGSVEKLRKECLGEERIRYFAGEDGGIYDAMNRAVAEATGQYLIFMNCGDYFADELVLNKVDRFIREKGDPKGILYGNRLSRKSGSVEFSAPEITPFVCFRNLPCHQSCIYSLECFRERKYDISYRVRADYEHFLWWYFQGGRTCLYMPITISSYEGGGFSENPANVMRSKKEHREITRKYLPLWQRFLFRAYLVVSLQPLRHYLAESPRFSAGYNRLVQKIYGLRRKKS